MNSTTDIITTCNNSGILPKIIEWSLAGNSRSDLINLIKSHSPDALTNIECNALIKQSKVLLAQTVHTDLKQTVNIHVNWYEGIFKYYNSIFYVDGMNRAMKAKEALLGLTGQSKVVINRRTEIRVRTKVVEYDMSKLSQPETNRLTHLLEKVKF